MITERRDEPAVLDAMELTADPQLAGGFAKSAHRILSALVAGGAALGWVEPPSPDEVAELLDDVFSAVRAGTRRCVPRTSTASLPGSGTGADTPGPLIGRTRIWRRSRWTGPLTVAVSAGP